MKKMNKGLVILLVAVMALPTLYSCTKKGENDPGLSLRSRKSRLTGEWTLQSGTTTTTLGSNSYTYIYTTNMVTINVGGNSNTYQYTETAVYEKDNTFKVTIVFDGDLTVTDGFWTFLGGYDEIKDQECLVLRVSSETTTSGTTIYTGDEMPTQVMRLSRLSNKEIIVEGQGTETSGSQTYNYTTSKVYARK